MKCAYCGKMFRITAAGWGYAYDGLYTCSYSCMRAMQREDGMDEKQKEEVQRLMDEGMNAREIAEKLQINPKAVGGYVAGKMRGKTSAAVDFSVPAKPEMMINGGQPAGEDVRMAVVRLIQDMLDVLKRLYGI